MMMKKSDCSAGCYRLDGLSVNGIWIGQMRVEACDHVHLLHRHRAEGIGAEVGARAFAGIWKWIKKVFFFNLR
jgi:hypothetical protein